MSEEKQKDSGRTTKRVRLSSELSVLAFQRICPKCNLPVIPGLEKCPRDGTSLKQHESGPQKKIAPLPQEEILQMSDRYDHLGSLGSGGMSVVYKARDKNLDRVVAIKQLISQVSSEKMVLRFQREACAYAALKHPNIVNVFDFGFDEENRPFLVMDFLEGQTLDEFLAERGPLSIPEALEIFIQILDGLSHAHAKGIVHRDLKPANVMIQRIGTSERIQVKLMDFGIAKVKVKDPQAAWQTQTGQVMGSVLYMSPEQSSSSTNVDGRSDLYAVGCMLFEMLTGAPPFRGDTMMETVTKHRHEQPPSMIDLLPKPESAKSIGSSEEFNLDMEAITLAAMEKDPEDRYQSASDMRADLLCVQENWNKTHPIESTKADVTSRHSRTRLVAVASIAAMLLSVGGVLTYANLNQKKAVVTTQVDPNSFRSKSRDYFTDFQNNTFGLSPETSLSSLEHPDSVKGLVVGQFRGRAKVSKEEEVAIVQLYSNRFDGLERLRNLRTLMIWNLQITPQLVERIASMKSLTKVSIVDTPVPHNIISVLSRLPNLSNLELKMCNVRPDDLVDLVKITRMKRVQFDDNNDIGSGNGLAPLSKLKHLDYVGLNNIHLSDQGVSYLCNLPDLQSLILERAELTPAGCKLLWRLPRLIWLDLKYSPTVDDRSVKVLAGLRNLENLDLRGCEKVTDKSVPYLCQMKKLTHLDLTGTAVTEAGIEELRKRLTLLKELIFNQKIDEINEVLNGP